MPLLDVDTRWRARPAFERPGAFVPICRDVIRDLCKLDERFCHLGRKVKRAENAAELPLDVLERSYKRGQQILSLASIYSPLDTSIHFSGGPGASIIDRPGRSHITFGEKMSRETDLLKTALAVMIGGFSADEARIWIADSEPHERGTMVWLDWKRDDGSPPIHPERMMRGEPASEEAWLGGTLRTWPAHDPCKIFADQHDPHA